MKRIIFVELFEEHESANFYTIRFQEAEESKVEAFLTKFDNEEYEEDINIILATIDKIGETGALERRFRPGRWQYEGNTPNLIRFAFICLPHQ